MLEPKLALMKALSIEQKKYREAVEHLSEEGLPPVPLLREAVELVGCLRRLTQNATRDEVHYAFGAPGESPAVTP